MGVVRILSTVVLLLATPAASSPPRPSDRSFYEHSIDVGFHRVENGALRRGSSRSQPEVMKEIAWIEGEWEQTNVVLHVNSIPAKSSKGGVVRFTVDRDDMTVDMQQVREGSRKHRLALYDPYGKVWVRVIDTRSGYGVLTAPTWTNGRLDLVGKATFLGRSFNMRHSLVRMGPDSFELQNAEQLRSGQWRLFDKHIYKRRTDGTPAT